jgi:hypothetical protein
MNSQTIEIITRPSFVKIDDILHRVIDKKYALDQKNDIVIQYNELENKIIFVMHNAFKVNQFPWIETVEIRFFITAYKGSDEAHKEAARQSETDWVVTVDADNIVDTTFFNTEFDSDQENLQVVSWLARNKINGLRYGNGGLKIWRKDYILNMKTHEASTNERAQVDFCWEQGYQQFKECYSETVITGSPFQAWRAGFREGVKMTLLDGVKVAPD